MSDASTPEQILKDLFRRALDAASPLTCVPPALPSPPSGRTIVIGAGKAAAEMARAVELNWTGALSGLVVTREGHSAPCKYIEVIEATHPVPTTLSTDAGNRILKMVSGLHPEDLVICLISGGGSALLEVPAAGIRFEDIQALNRALLRSGAPIFEMNCVRKHLSAIKGGRLAEALQPARLVTIAISDVPGDDASTIASGPTVADPTSRHDAIAILQKYAIAVPDEITAHLSNPASETPKPNDPIFARNNFVMATRPKHMIAAVDAAARSHGFDVLNLGADIEGEASMVGRHHAKMASRQILERTSIKKPLLILSGGETTVTVTGEGGRGGRNCEYLLSLAIELRGAAGVHALAADTDGIDGSEDNAGAYMDPTILERAEALGLEPRSYLAAHDSYSFFDKMGALIKTGPTRTNVNDLRMIFISPE